MEPTADETADAAIELIESMGYALQPWQATALRALLDHPVGMRFMAAPPRQHPRPLPRDWRDEVDRIVGKRGEPPIFDETPPRPGMIKVAEAQQWLWKNPNEGCTCTFDNHGSDSGCPRHDK